MHKHIHIPLRTHVQHTNTQKIIKIQHKCSSPYFLEFPCSIFYLLLSLHDGGCMPWHTWSSENNSEPLPSLLPPSKEPTQVIRHAPFTARLSTWPHLVFSRPRFIQITTLGWVFLLLFLLQSHHFKPSSGGTRL